jgi:hypothetical protein
MGNLNITRIFAHSKKICENVKELDSPRQKRFVFIEDNLSKIPSKYIKKYQKYQYNYIL